MFAHAVDVLNTQTLHTHILLLSRDSYLCSNLQGRSILAVYKLVFFCTHSAHLRRLAQILRQLAQKPSCASCASTATCLRKFLSAPPNGLHLFRLNGYGWGERSRSGWNSRSGGPPKTQRCVVQGACCAELERMPLNNALMSAESMEMTIGPWHPPKPLHRANVEHPASLCWSNPRFPFFSSIGLLLGILDIWLVVKRRRGGYTVMRDVREWGGGGRLGVGKSG